MVPEARVRPTTAQLRWEVRMTVGAMRREQNPPAEPDPLLACMNRYWCEQRGIPWLEVKQ